MENKKGNLSTIFLVIAIILIVVMGALLYMQKTEADRQIAELKNNESELQEKNDFTTNTIDSKDIYEKCENKFSNVEYRRETGSSSNFFIKDGILYAGEENLIETHAKTTGIVGKAKYVVPVNKQTGIAVVLTENGKLFINKELSNDFSSILEEHKILEIINIPNEDEHLLLASDGKILKLDGMLYLDLLKEDNNSIAEDTKTEKLEIPSASTNISDKEEKIISNYFKGVWITSNGEKILAVDYGKRFCIINESNNSKEYGTYTVEDETEPTITLTYTSGKTLTLKLTQGGTSYLMSNDGKVQYLNCDAYYFGASEGDEGIFSK